MSNTRDELDDRRPALSAQARLATYDPPNGVDGFVAVLRSVPNTDATDLLRKAFEGAQVKALLVDLRVKSAASDLYEACKAMLVEAERHQYSLDPDWLMAIGKVQLAVEKAEGQRA